MPYEIKQMLPAEAGMYLIEGRTATLIVMWVLVEHFSNIVEQKIIGLTVTNLSGNLADNLADRFNHESVYSSRVHDKTYNVTR